MPEAVLNGYYSLVKGDDSTDFAIVPPTPYLHSYTKIKRWWNQSYDKVTYTGCALISYRDAYIVVSCDVNVLLKIIANNDNELTFNTIFKNQGDGGIRRILVCPKTELHNLVNYDDYYYDYSDKQIKRIKYGSGGLNPSGPASLDLQFAANKSLVDVVSGNNLITFSRASSGTYVDSDGLIKTAATDAPRFDHDPVTGESLGLLIEEARTNFQEYSVVSTSNGWDAVRLTLTTNQATVPDNSSSAALITENTSNSSRYFTGSNHTFTSGTTYCNSMFFKAGTLDLVQVTLPSAAFGTSQYANFDLTNGVVTAEVNGTAFIKPYQNGWYRCSFAAVATATTSGAPGAVLIGSATDGRVPQYLGTSKTLYVWGAQVEAGSFPTSYIPTPGSTVTRAADIATIEGTNFSSWYNQSEGTVFAEFRAPTVDLSSDNRALTVAQGTSAAGFLAIAKRRGTGQLLIGIYATGQELSLNTNWSTAQKSALAYESTGYTFAGNGSTRNNSAAMTVNPNLDNMRIGQRESGTNYLNGHISRLAYFPTRKTDQELVNMTS